MCGIAGIFTVERPVDAEMVSSVLRMMDAQAHRGPNDWGLLLPDEAMKDPEVRGLLSPFPREHIRTYPGSAAAPAAVVGARRLSIIDLSPRGRMPMGNAARSVWITFNGEIYNYRELRAELKQRGYSFESDTDTETILHGYEEWGEDVVQHLRGMFAFAVLDARIAGEPKLFLAKDRFGMKPLYWGRKNCVLQFASEVRAFMSGGLIPNEPEPRGFHGFLIYGSVPTPFTTVRDVFSLPAAHTLSVDEIKYSYPAPRRYWSLPEAGSITVNHQEAATEVRRLLDESIRLHLVSDVPLGVFLSGGMDSSAITALASKRLSHPLTTLCVTFDEAEFDEGHHAAKVASRFNCKHIEIRLRAREFVEEIPKILGTMDQPSIDGINTYFIAKAARSAGLTVALSGLGGDEVFWGYPGFRSGPLLYKWARFPGARLGAALIGGVAKRFGYERLEKLEFLRDGGPVGAYMTIRGLFPPSRAARILGAGELPFRVRDDSHESLGPSEYAELETSLYLQNQLLRDTDVFGMAHSFEIRVPFLDHHLAEFVFGLPESVKISTGLNKPLLVSALGKDLGPESIKRPKLGFTFPFAHWMKEFNAELSAYTDHSGPTETAEAKLVWEAFSRGRIHWSRPWALAALSGMSKRGSLPAWPKERSPHKVLFLLPDVYASKGGISVYNQNLLRAVSESFPRSELRVISVNDAKIPPGASVIGCAHFTGCGLRDSRYRKARVVVAAIREASRKRPDLVICGHINLAPLAFALAVLSRTSCVLLAHGIEVWTPRSFLRWAACRMHRVLPVSRFTAERMAEWGVRRSRMRILPDSVDGEVFRPVGRNKQIDGRTLLTVARLDASERYKGVDLVIEALTKLIASHPEVRYVVAGKGDDLGRLKALAHEYNVADRVDFRGFVSDEDLPTLFSHSDLFVMPSRGEGFGIVFLEALACGVPVVAGNQDGSVDAVLDGRIGLLVDPTDVRDVERGILNILDNSRTEVPRDPTLLRRQALASYGFDRFRDEIRSIILDLFEGKAL